MSEFRQEFRTSPITKADLIQLLEVHSRSQVAQHLQISERTLSRRLREFELIHPNYGRKGMGIQEWRQMRELYWRQHWTQREIGVRFGISQSMVARILNSEQSLEFGGQAQVKVGYRYGD